MLLSFTEMCTMLFGAVVGVAIPVGKAYFTSRLARNPNSVPDLAGKEALEQLEMDLKTTTNVTRNPQPPIGGVDEKSARSSSGPAT